MRRERDPSLDALLDLDGQVFVVDEQGSHWVKFAVRQVAVTLECPHGLAYSLTLHGKDNERLVGFDKCACSPGLSRARGKRQQAFDHKDAATLLADFWNDLE